MPENIDIATRIGSDRSTAIQSPRSCDQIALGFKRRSRIVQAGVEHGWFFAGAWLCDVGAIPCHVNAAVSSDSHLRSANRSDRYGAARTIDPNRRRKRLSGIARLHVVQIAMLGGAGKVDQMKNTVPDLSLGLNTARRHANQTD